MKKPRILVVGSLVMDLVAETPRFPKAGETLLGTSFTTACGGKGANQAVQAARLGAEVTMVGKVGCDSFGDEMVKSVGASGVDVRHILRTDKASSAVGHIQIEKRAGEVQNRILVIPGANMLITPEDVRFLEAEIGDYDLVMMQLEIPVEINRIVTGFARKAGVRVMLNPAPYTHLGAEDYDGVTFVSPNETEAEAMLGFPVHSPAEAGQALAQMHAMGIENPMITLGSAGAVCLWNGETIFEKALPDLPVKDPTAAGDSFVAAFSTAVAAGCGIRGAMTFAKHAAGITVCRLGAQPSLPKTEEVFASLEAAGEMDAELAALKEALTGQSAFEHFKRVVHSGVEQIQERCSESELRQAAEIIWKAQENGNRVHVTGIGKPAHVAGYYASLLSSTGTPAYFLHGTEAVHGSCGQLVKGDVVLCISNSGETQEMKATCEAIARNGCVIIGVSGDPNSWLARFAAIHLCAHADEEGGPLNRAPRMSILAEAYVLQALSVILQDWHKQTPEEYVRCHPGGKLGELKDC